MYSKNGSRFPQNVEYGDIVKGLPVAPNSCSGVYCSHVLEHLSLDDFRIAIHNTYRVLRPDGIFRLVLPDLEYYAKEYLRDPLSDAAHAFMKETSLGHQRRAKSFKDFLVLWIGNSQHLWMWDYKSIATELRNAGFSSVRRAAFGDSSDPRFQEVEDKERWENCLGVECKKPDITALP